jgi:hypothetical protein
MFFQLLQPNVMHSLNKITNQHIYAFDIVELLQILRKED